jgi:hypothetical protein
VTVPTVEPPAECVPRSEILANSGAYPWFPLNAQLCGDYRGEVGVEPWYRMIAAPAPGGGPGGELPHPEPEPTPIPPPPDNDFSDEYPDDTFVQFAADKRKTLQQGWDYIVFATRMMNKTALRLTGRAAQLPKLVK